MLEYIQISGESGAGKTESTKLIIKQLVELCKGNNQLEQQILQVNPLLEAFGNAQTLMNDNSSRFGKYIQLKFQGGSLMGAKISEYLLEKSRVVYQNPGEENFHIFYYMFAGLSPEQQNKYRLKNASGYKYLCEGKASLKTSFSKHQNYFAELLNAMDLVGFEEQEQTDMFQILSAVLSMGNLEFENNESDAAYLKDSGHLETVASLLGIEEQLINDVLTHSQTVTKGEVVRRNYTKEFAEDCRDAMTKALYGRVFGWIVNKINQLLAPSETVSPSESMEIGILDIFGFEHFEVNSFEQACINLANEQLQFFFNQHIFMLEQEEYETEGIDWTSIPFVNNQPLLDFFLGRPIGLFALLDEESLFPQATDHTFVEKMNRNFMNNHFYVKSKDARSNIFSIDHYAARVEYSADGFLEKNRDTLPQGVMQLLQESKNCLLSQIFRGTITRTGTLALQMRTSRGFSKRKRNVQLPTKAGQRKLTLGAQFKNSLNVLMEKMSACNPHFIRCIKPNTTKAANLFEDHFVLLQLRYCGMLETTRIRKQGYAIRQLFSDFVEKYKILALKSKLSSDKNGCVQILKATGLQNWQLGKTKVFLKYFHADELASKIEEMAQASLLLQKVVRGFLARRRFAKLKEDARRWRNIANNFLNNIEKLNHCSYEKQQVLIQKDQIIPQDFFKGLGKGSTPSVRPTTKELPKPPVPAHATADVRNKDDDQQKTKKEPEYDEADDSEEDILEDEFLRTKKNMKYGPEGTRQASIRWFKETQSKKLSAEGFAPWFHGIITRRDAEKLLWDKPIGCFLLRVSESRFGYSLSFRVKERCKHFMIDQTPSGKYVVVGEPKVHESLKALVTYHQKNPISPFGDLLTEPCGQKDGEVDYAELLDGPVRVPPSRPPLPPSNLPTTSKPVTPDVHGRSDSLAPPLPDRNRSPKLPRKKGKAPPPPQTESQTSQAPYLSLIRNQRDQHVYQKTGGDPHQPKN
ncbi:myosin-IIIb-like isoform X2 [Ptychodera flava]|uniref:myosin-IIIb-like isoform X2 n=1 Tax=Ptychodera flava TaxID=63121 RepID=UPI00396A6BD4